MKNFLMLFALIFTTFSYAQELNQAKFEMSGAELASALEKGEISFFFSKALDAQTVKENSQFYTNYFSVQHDASTGKVTLKMTADDMARLVISRFMMSCGINEVIIGGKTISVHDFMAEYLKQ